MKKLLFFITIATLGFSQVIAQEYKVGVNLGLPLGDIKDFSVINFGVDAAILWGSDVFKGGITTGYSYFLGKSNVDDVNFVPLAVATRLNLNEKLSVGFDLGAGIRTSAGSDGGFYYAPKVQYVVGRYLDIVLAYKGLTVSTGNINSLNAGVEFNL